MRGFRIASMQVGLLVSNVSAENVEFFLTRIYMPWGIVTALFPFDTEDKFSRNGVSDGEQRSFASGSDRCIEWHWV